jgi:hypothetical protein
MTSGCARCGGALRVRLVPDGVVTTASVMLDVPCPSCCSPVEEVGQLTYLHGDHRRITLPEEKR